MRIDYCPVKGAFDFTNSSFIYMKIITHMFSFFIVMCLGVVTTTVTPVHVFARTSQVITSFSFSEGVGVITEPAHTIAVTVPYGTDVTALMPTITHNGTSISPESGAVHDFTSPVTYTVSDVETESSTDYTVTVTVAPNPAKNILSFAMYGATGIVGTSTVVIEIPYNLSLSSLTPIITISGVSVSPLSGSSQDFTTPVTYTVTAADESSKDYTVTVTRSSSPFTISSSGSCPDNRTITILSHMWGEGSIYYTTDGSDPERVRGEYTGSSNRYTEPFTLVVGRGESKTVKAFYSDGEYSSEVITSTYTCDAALPAIGGGYFISLPSGKQVDSPFAAPTIIQPQNSSTQGQVLGVIASCKESGQYLTHYARIGYDNDVDTVKKLQTFLNKEIGANIPVTGFFGPMTEAKLKEFQLIHKNTLLAPWGITEPTGILYITTMAQINHLMCADFPLTELGTKLIPFNENPDTPKKL